MARRIFSACILMLACRASAERHEPPLVIRSLEPAAEGLAEPIRMEVRDPAETPPMFVMRGGPRGDAKMVFLHGMCGHGLGYAQAFQFSAAKKGTLIAPQGDVSCGGPWSKWSNKLDELDRRITDAFRELGVPGEVDDVLVIGYSQGATRAESLARRWPQRYTRLIAMGMPNAVNPVGLKALRGSVMMTGERDRRDLAKESAARLRAWGIPSTFMVIPQATHGAMGPTPEKTMGEALDWLWANQKPR